MYLGYKPEYYIMSARGNSELRDDKNWRANSTFLFVKTRQGKKMMISGSGHNYNEIGTTASYIFDTGNGYRKPAWNDEKFTVVDKVLFDKDGNPNKQFNYKGWSFYVMK